MILGCQKSPHEPTGWVQIAPAGENAWAIRVSDRDALGIIGHHQDAYTHIAGGDGIQVKTPRGMITLPNRADTRCKGVRFAVLGDSRAEGPRVGPSAYWAGILREIKGHTPDFILHTGDLVKDGRNSDEWASYLKQTPAWPPVVPVRGNHDRGGLFENRLAVDTPVHFFRWGPVLFLGIDTEIDEADLESQLVQVEAILSAEKAAWRVVYLHRPIWSRGHHGSDERRWNKKLVPLFDRYRVDLVLAGHDHNYERFCASRGLGENRACSPRDGRIYVVTGGGATFTNHFPGLARSVEPDVAKKDRDSSLIFTGSRHFLMVDASVSKLSVSVHRTRTGNVRPAALIDQFEIRRSNGCDGV